MARPRRWPAPTMAMVGDTRPPQVRDECGSGLDDECAPAAQHAGRRVVELVVRRQDPEVRRHLQKLFERHPGLAAGGCAEAVMDAVTEGDMRVLRATDVEDIGVGERVGIMRQNANRSL
jgi:hypothetical protein